MSVKVQSFGYQNEELRKAAFAVRHSVFVIEQGVNPGLEYDSHEEESVHYLLTDDGCYVGAARWRKTVQGIKLERFAVLEPFRDKGYGAMILELVLQDVLRENLPVYLHAQLRAVPFYEKHGFRKEGDVFTEADMMHYRMTYSGKLTD